MTDLNVAIEILTHLLELHVGLFTPNVKGLRVRVLAISVPFAVIRLHLFESDLQILIYKFKVLLSNYYLSNIFRTVILFISNNLQNQTNKTIFFRIKLFKVYLIHLQMLNKMLHKVNLVLIAGGGVYNSFLVYIYFEISCQCQ